MSSEEETTTVQGRGDLFGLGGEELSDLEGDEVSDLETHSAADDEDNSEPEIAPPETEQQQEQPDSQTDSKTTTTTATPGAAAEEMVPAKKPKLPSFKKRTREGDSEEMQKVREELKQKKKKGSKKKADAEVTSSQEDGNTQEEQPQQDPEVKAALEEFDRNVARLLSGKRKRKKVDEEDLERSLDEELLSLRERMKAAAEEDTIANSERRPALAKLKMLPEVTTVMNNKRAHDSILDNQLLDAVRLWLEPLPDRSLPSLDIQNEMLDALDKLPIASDHLRESGVGKIVYFYQKSPRVEPNIKRKADQLVGKWSRLVIKRSANYRERRHQFMEYSQEQMLSRHKRIRITDEDSADSSKPYVSIPQAVAPDYDIIPQSTVKPNKRIKSKEGSIVKRLTYTMKNLKPRK